MKTIESMEEIITQQSFWKDLSPNYVAMLTECARLEHFKARQNIFCRGQYAAAFYIIRHGTIAIETPYIPNKGNLTIQTLHEGEAVGWSWYFYPYEWHFTAFVSEPTEVVAFDTYFLRDRARKDVGFGFELANRIANVVFHRLQATRLQLMDVYASAP